jgi:hypothetical protein
MLCVPDPIVVVLICTCVPLASLMGRSLRTGELPWSPTVERELALARVQS